MMPYPRHKAIKKPIASAPKDGTAIYVYNSDDNDKLYKVKWDSDGDSWQNGVLVNTGFWLDIESGGWFEPNEVQFWLRADEVFS